MNHSFKNTRKKTGMMRAMPVACGRRKQVTDAKSNRVHVSHYEKGVRVAWWRIRKTSACEYRQRCSVGVEKARDRIWRHDPRLAVVGHD